MTVKNNFPTIRPSLNLDFANTKQLDPRITFTRASTATYFDEKGALRTAAAGVPRIDHDPATGECKGLLIEEQRTNLLLYSEQIDNAAWTKNAVALATNVQAAPGGTLTATRVNEDTSAGLHHVLRGLPEVAKNIHQTLSVFVKAAGRSSVRLVINAFSSNFLACFFDLANGTAGVPIASGTASAASASITPIGNGWYRCSLSGIPSSATGTGIDAVVRLAQGSTDNYTGDGFSGIYIWGAQLEAGSFATSYIPTVASQVTRSADSAVMTGTNFSSWYRQDEGTLCSEGSSFEVATSTTVRRHFSVSDGAGTTNNVIATYNYTNLLGGVVRANNTVQCDLGQAGYSQNAYSKMAIAYKVNDFAFSSNGASTGTDSVGTIPTVTQAQVGALAGLYLNGHIRRIAYYPKRLSNTELQALTA